jgi:hypothetical protein
MARRAPWYLLFAVAAALGACSGSGGSEPTTVRRITVSPTTAALCVGDSVSLAAAALDGAGQPVLGASVRWSSSAPETVRVDSLTGLARAVTTGAANITARSEGVASSPVSVDVPADLLPEFMPDSLVLAPGDTMTLGTRLRRSAGGPVPDHRPQIAGFDSAVAAIDASGLVRAKAVGRAGLSLSACGFQGRGAVDVYTPPDTASGQAYLWLSGRRELRVRLPARANNFTRTNGGPASQIFSSVGTQPNISRFLLYEDTVALTGVGTYVLDSLLSSEAMSQTLLCAPPRPFTLYLEVNPPTLLVSLTGGAARVTSYVPQAGFTAISGRLLLQMRGVVAGGTQVDTLTAVYTFSAPLVTVAGACP